MGLFDSKRNVYKTNNLHLIDATNMFCRSALVQYKGKSVEFGVRVANFFKMFKHAVKDRPRYCAVVFDSGKLNFRHSLYPEYKANRKKSYIKDEELLLLTIKRILHYSGFTVLGSDCYEADDVIGALTRFASNKNHVYIFSEDKDYLQLVSDHVSLYKGKILYTRQTTKAKFGIWPEQFIDYLTLVGDSVDNIPGIRLWGKKTAVEYLQKYENIQQIQKQNIPKSLSQIYDYELVNLCHSLVKIKRNIKVADSIDSFCIRDRTPDKLGKILKQHKIFIGDIYG